MFRTRNRSTLSIFFALITPLSVLHAQNAVLIEDPVAPNVVLITSDHLSLAELEADKLSPFQHLSKLHAQSHKFVNYYIAPAIPLNHASIYTGRYNIRTKCVDYGYGRSMMAGDEVTLSEILSGAGYKSAFYGTWHLGNNFPLRPNDRGFHECLAQFPKFIPPHEEQSKVFAFHNNAECTLTHPVAQAFASQLTSFIRSAYDLETPFFLNLNIHSEAGADTPQQLADLDQQLAALYSTLTELKADTNTLIVFTSTLGSSAENLGLRGTQDSVYEAGVLAPLWLVLPSNGSTKTTAKSITTLAAQIDILPTILDYCKLGSPDAFDIDGTSLIPSVNSVLPIEIDRAIIQQHHRGATVSREHHFMLRKGNWKLLNPSDPQQSRKPSSNYELYKLSTDSEESINLASKEPKVLKELLATYNAWFDDVTETRIRERGIAPILVSREHENPLLLTEDTRISKYQAEDGFWKLQAEHNSRIDINFELPDHTAESLEGWSASVSLRGNTYQQKLSSQTDHVHLTSIPLKKGRNILQVSISSPDSKTSIFPKQVQIMHR